MSERLSQPYSRPSSANPNKHGSGGGCFFWSPENLGAAVAQTVPMLSKAASSPGLRQQNARQLDEWFEINRKANYTLLAMNQCGNETDMLLERVSEAKRQSLSRAVEGLEATLDNTRRKADAKQEQHYQLKRQMLMKRKEWLAQGGHANHEARKVAALEGMIEQVESAYHAEGDKLQATYHHMTQRLVAELTAQRLAVDELRAETKKTDAAMAQALESLAAVRANHRELVAQEDEYIRLYSKRSAIMEVELQQRQEALGQVESLEVNFDRRAEARKLIPQRVQVARRPRTSSWPHPLNTLDTLDTLDTPNTPRPRHASADASLPACRVAQEEGPDAVRSFLEERADAARRRRMTVSLAPPHHAPTTCVALRRHHLGECISACVCPPAAHNRSDGSSSSP